VREHIGDLETAAVSGLGLQFEFLAGQTFLDVRRANPFRSSRVETLKRRFKLSVRFAAANFTQNIASLAPAVKPHNVSL
jgi:hypothetical protein